MESADLREQARRSGRAARTGLSGDQRLRAETLLISHLRSIPALRRGSVGVFVAHDGEPDLMPLVQWLWDNDVVVALPVLLDDPNDFSMRFVQWERDDVLQPGRYDIPVPPSGQAIELDTVLVSFTGFDASGNRIGRGGGFFDRYLATTNANVIGVGFEAQRMQQVPVESHDQPLPMVVTDLGIRIPMPGANRA